MAGEREIEEETRIQMMQNLFGEQSEDEEEEDEEEEGVDEPDAAESESERGAPPPVSGYPSEGEGDIEIEGEGEVDIEGHGEVEPESDAEMHGVDSDQGESEVERAQTSEERGVHDQRLESEERDAESDEHEYEQRVVTSKRRNVIPSESEKSEEDHHYDIDDDEEVEGHPHEVNGEEGFVEHHYEINDRQGVKEHHSEMSDEEEVGQEKKGRSPSEEPDLAVFRDVFGESDEDEVAYSKAPYEPEQEQPGSAVEEDKLGNYEKTLAPEDIVPDEYAHYGSEDENAEQKANEKPMGPPLDMEIPLQRPPGLPDKMNMIKVSNIMGIEPKPFDSKTYVEEDVFITDESGAKKRIRLEDNIVRWRSIRNRDGSNSYESNARFVKWSDGSLQLLIGNEVLDLTVQESQHDHTHLFLRHGKGILQSQGRLLRKMRFMPSSLSSKSHRLLTALVDSRHKKVYKVKNCITDIDPEREKEEKERAEGQSIRANEILLKKRERVAKKYTPGIDRGRQLSPGFLEEALDEDNEHEDYAWRSSRRRLEEDMELEIRGEERIADAKRPRAWKNARKQSLPSAHSGRHHEYLESEKEESEYESDGEEMERSPEPTRPESDNEDEYQDQYDEETVAANADSEEEEPEMYRESGGFKRKDFESDEEDAPPRKTLPHRRKAVVFDSDDE